MPNSTKKVKTHCVHFELSFFGSTLKVVTNEIRPHDLVCTAHSVYHRNSLANI